MSERFLITVDGGPVADVVARLEAAGARVEKVLDAVGVIVVSFAGDAARSLAGIPGVAAVEPDREVRPRDPEPG